MKWATTYFIEPSGKPTQEAEAILKNFVKNLCEDPQVLANVAAQMSGRDVKEYAEAIEKYKTSEDMTIVCDRVEDTGAFRIKQRVWGVGKNVDINTDIRRAFCRLVMTHCHSNGFDVDIHVE